MPADRDVHSMLLRVRQLLGHYPDIMRDYLFYRSEVEFQRQRLDAAELKALNRFDQLMKKHRAWIATDVYTTETLAEARDQFDQDHWWWYITP